MPKPVKVRVSYRDDGAYLLRLESAVGKDERQTTEWRKQTCDQIRALALRILDGDKTALAVASSPVGAQSKIRASR